MSEFLSSLKKKKRSRLKAIAYYKVTSIHNPITVTQKEESSSSSITGYRLGFYYAVFLDLPSLGYILYTTAYSIRARGKAS